MTFNVKIDSKGVQKRLRKFAAAYAKEMRRSLDETANGIIATIRARHIWPNEKVGVLKQGLWAGEPVSTRGNTSISAEQNVYDDQKDHRNQENTPSAPSGPAFYPQNNLLKKCRQFCVCFCI